MKTKNLVSLLMVVILLFGVLPANVFADEVLADRVKPNEINWADYLTPEALAETKAEWQNFNYNMILNIAAELNYGSSIVSEVDVYHTGDTLKLPAISLFLDQKGIGKEAILDKYHAQFDQFFANLRTIIDIKSDYVKSLNEPEYYRDYAIWTSQADVDALLSKIDGLEQSGAKVILFYNNGGYSYEPGIVTFNGKKYWVIEIGLRGTHAAIQTIQNAESETKTANAMIFKDVEVIVTDQKKLETVKKITLNRAKSIYSEWPAHQKLSFSRNGVFNMPEELKMPLDDRPLWWPSFADGYYGSEYDEDYRLYQSINLHDLAWAAAQPRIVALDAAGNEADVMAGIVKSLRGMTDEQTLPMRKFKDDAVPTMSTAINNDVIIKVNGVTLADAKAYLKSNGKEAKTVAPIAIIGEVFGYQSNWDGKFQIAELRKDDQNIQLYIGGKEIICNGISHPASIAPFIDSNYNRTYAAIADIAEVLGAPYTWSDNPPTADFISS